MHCTAPHPSSLSNLLVCLSVHVYQFLECRHSTPVLVLFPRSSPSSAIYSFHLILPCPAHPSPQPNPNRTTRIYPMPIHLLHQQTELLFSTGEPGPIHPTVDYAYPTSLAHTEPRDATGESSDATKPSSFELAITHDILIACLLDSCKLIQFHQLSNNVLEHDHSIKRNKVSNSLRLHVQFTVIMTLIVREPTSDMCVPSLQTRATITPTRSNFVCKLLPLPCLTLELSPSASLQPSYQLPSKGKSFGFASRAKTPSRQASPFHFYSVSPRPRCH